MRNALLKNFRDQGIKIHTMTAAERKPFVDKCKKVHKQFERKVGKALLTKVKKALKKLRGK
jgi:TRAP-type C4-dicarboxylate transport system substrate-binding protein